MSRKLLATLALSLLTFFALADYHGAEAPEQVAVEADVAITLENVGPNAWMVAAVEGPEEISELNMENPTLRLEVGQRYHFDVSEVNSEFHPLDFRDAEGNFLLAQGEQEGTFEADEAVAFEANDDAVVFTLTEELAEVIATYHCTVHPPMVGEIEVLER